MTFRLKSKHQGQIAPMTSSLSSSKNEIHLCDTDFTQDPEAESWVVSAQQYADFPIQNLPMGVVTDQSASPTLACAIGDEFLDLTFAASMDLLLGIDDQIRASPQQINLNAWMGLEAKQRQFLRRQIFNLLSSHGMGSQLSPDVRSRIVRSRKNAQAKIAANVGDYTNFYAEINHATEVRKLFRPYQPLLPNYKHVPIGCHGRASSLVASGRMVRRPHRQLLDESTKHPYFHSTQRLDFGLELEIWISGRNERGTPIGVEDADDAIAGYCLLNDWSARDIQAWEYQLLGPFLSKSFATSIFPWIVTAEALRPFTVRAMKRTSNDLQPLPYLLQEKNSANGVDVQLEVPLSTQKMRRLNIKPLKITTTSTKWLWWTPRKLVVHHTCGACNLHPGDLFGSGIISGLEKSSFGSLLEMTNGGRHALRMPSGESRFYLEDGDESTICGKCERSGFKSIGLGTCSGTFAD